MNKQKIMFVIYSLGVGGTERALVNILKNLNRNKFFPCLVLLAKDTTLKREIPKDIPITKLGVEGRLATLQLILPLARVTKEQKTDIIVSFMWGSNLIVLLTKVLTRFKSKIILREQTLLGKDILNYKFLWLRKLLIKKLYPKADTIIAVSSGIKENLLEEFRIPEEKVEIIHNGIDLKNVETLAKAPFQSTFKEYIIAVGRLRKEKNHSLLLKAFAKIGEKRNIGLVILGEGRERKNLENLINSLGLNGKVLMPGVVDNPYPWLAHGKVFILCSKYEGFPNVILEAMACKIPVVATRCHGVPEEMISNGLTGILIENNNAEKLEEAMSKLLDNPSLAKEISKKAFVEVKRWDIKKITKEYETVFKST